VKRVLALAGGGLLALALLLALVGYGTMHGWNLTRVPAAQVSALLRPWDEVVTPEGPGPFPTVIGFHGCGGKRAAQGEWARWFREAGFASVIVDSFAGRGLDAAAVCGGRRLLPMERAGDVLVSLADVRRLPFVDPARIVLAGWSHGSVAIMDLLVMDPPREIPPNLERESGETGGARGLEGVAGVVLFYPYCGIGSRSWTGTWAWRAPILFLLAGADRVVSPDACLEAAGALEAAGQRVETRLYPGADHAFDQNDHPPGSPLRFDPVATADARERLRAFLAKLARPGAARAQAAAPAGSGPQPRPGGHRGVLG